MYALTMFFYFGESKEFVILPKEMVIFLLYKFKYFPVLIK